MMTTRYEKGTDFRLSKELLAQISKHDSRLVSPIDLSLEIARPLLQKPLKWVNFFEPPLKMALKNSGDTVMVIGRWESQRPYLTSGHILEGDYVFSQIHFHWGNKDHHRRGKHTIAGLSYPLEMHAVFYKSCYKNETAAREKEDGVVIVVYFFKEEEEEESSMSWLTRVLEKVCVPLTVTSLPPVPLSALMVPFTRDYLMYWGALTCACPHVVQWVIARTFLGITHNELRMFRKLQSVVGKESTRMNRFEAEGSTRTLFHVNPSAHKRHLLLPESVEPPCQISVGPKTIVITMCYHSQALVKRGNSRGSEHNKNREDSGIPGDVHDKRKSPERKFDFCLCDGNEMVTRDTSSEISKKSSETDMNAIRKLLPNNLKGSPRSKHQRSIETDSIENKKISSKYSKGNPSSKHDKSIETGSDEVIEMPSKYSKRSTSPKLDRPKSVEIGSNEIKEIPSKCSKGYPSSKLDRPKSVDSGSNEIKKILHRNLKENLSLKHDKSTETNSNEFKKISSKNSKGNPTSIHDKSTETDSNECKKRLSKNVKENLTSKRDKSKETYLNEIKKISFKVSKGNPTSTHDKSTETDSNVFKKELSKDSKRNSASKYDKSTETDSNEIKKISTKSSRGNPTSKHDKSTETDSVEVKRILKSLKGIPTSQHSSDNISFKTHEILKNNKKEHVKFIIDTKREWAKKQRAKILTSHKLLNRERNIVANMRKRLLKERAERYIMKVLLEAERNKNCKEEGSSMKSANKTETQKFKEAEGNEIGDVLKKEKICEQSGDMLPNAMQDIKEFLKTFIICNEEMDVKYQVNHQRTNDLVTEHGDLGTVTGKSKDVKDKPLNSDIKDSSNSSPKPPVIHQEIKTRTLGNGNSTNQDGNTNKTTNLTKKRELPRSRLPVPVATYKRPKPYRDLQSSLEPLFNNPPPPEKKDPSHSGTGAGARQGGALSRPNPRKNVPRPPEKRKDVSRQEPKSFRPKQP